MRDRDTFCDYVLEQLREAGEVDCRAMFGGHGLYRDGRFFGILHRGRFYLKTSPMTRKDFEKAGMTPFKPNARQTLRSYYEVPADVLESPAELSLRVRDALRTAPPAGTGAEAGPTARLRKGRGRGRGPGAPQDPPGGTAPHTL